MNKRKKPAGPVLAASLFAVLTISSFASADSGKEKLPNMLRSVNANGVDATFSNAGFIDLKNPFFQSLGTNGRSCASCHVPSEGWTITPKGVQARFDKSQGTDPIFRLNDGANTPKADISTVDNRRKAYSMLLSRGNIRVGIGIPANAEFDLVQADDPYGFASAKELSLFRRPMPSTNLKFLSGVMWDGRETFTDANSRDCLFGTATCFAPIHFDLAHQSNEATTGHAQSAQPLTAQQREAIVNFEMGLFTAQVEDHHAGNLTAGGARGGPEMLKDQVYYFGINDTVVGDYRTHAAFNPNSMSLYKAWNRYLPDSSGRTAHLARLAIARGEVLFNSKPIQIRNVKGLNDDLNTANIPGTCTTCHNAPNSGNHSVPMPLDIGISDASRRTPDMPLYTLRNKVTGETIKTTDPGRALLTGKWKDIGRFKGPVLRSVSSRAPYFHDGSAKDLKEVVEFYNTRFGIGFTNDEKRDLIAFLGAL